jgi:hypothetical protein
MGAQRSASSARLTAAPAGAGVASSAVLKASAAAPAMNLFLSSMSFAPASGVVGPLGILLGPGVRPAT